MGGVSLGWKIWTLGYLKTRYEFVGIECGKPSFNLVAI